MSETPSDAAPGAVPPPVVAEVVRGSATEEELAAVVVVVSEAYEAEAAAAVAPEAVARSRWELSARGLRRPLNRLAGWHGFTG